MDYEIVIGLEVHSQLLTRSKMFCGCNSRYQDAESNTTVCPVCMGMPGVLPVINRQAIEFIIKTGLALDCTFCHRNVTSAAAATIPSVQQCMFCHTTVDGTTDTARQEIDILQAAFANNQPINWTRVHRLPDHVEFVHDAHVRFLTANPDEIVNATNLIISADGTVSASQTCSTCHGAVENMVKVKQVRALKMGDCVDCHRQYQAPTDCTTCHY